MEEAILRKRNFRNPLRVMRKFLTRRPGLRNQRGQGVLEFVLVMIISIVFLRFVFFNKTYGMKAAMDRTMLTLGSYLEANLKSGTKPGGDGTKSLEAFGGTNSWSN